MLNVYAKSKIRGHVIQEPILSPKVLREKIIVGHRIIDDRMEK